MKILLIFPLFCYTFFQLNAGNDMPEKSALKKLMSGNERFVNSSFKSLKNYHIDRLTTIEGQKPFAIILACSDSRVAPEIIFDQSIGELFVIRVAGNILGDTEWETIKFGVKILGIDTILVLGHEACGAVVATIQKTDLNVPILAAKITKGIAGETDVSKAVKANVRYVAGELKSRLKGSNVAVAGGYYQLTTGKVELLDMNSGG